MAKQIKFVIYCWIRISQRKAKLNAVWDKLYVFKHYEFWNRLFSVIMFIKKLITLKRIRVEKPFHF
jgi:hypothetical protein